MTEIEPRDAATVMLVRDGHDGLEVFMLQRRIESAFVPGFYVFPGGAVDEDDRHADLEAVCAGRSDDEASQLIGVDSGALAFWVAAVRECFEEAGVLLAYDEEGAVVSFADDEVAARFEKHRDAVDTGATRLIELCQRERLRIATDRIHYFGHWITPVGAPRRYDTRFFVTAAPPEQVPLHDDRETIAHAWVRPADALHLHFAGELDLLPPTSKSLEAIGRFGRAKDLLAAAADVTGGATVVETGQLGQGRRIPLPGDDA